MEPTVGQRIEAAQTKRANLVKLYEHAFLSKLEAGHALSEQDVADKVRLKELIEAAEQNLRANRDYLGSQDLDIFIALGHGLPVLSSGGAMIACSRGIHHMMSFPIPNR